MARKQTKKLICLTEEEEEGMSEAESGKLINENVRMLKRCQTLEEIKKLLKTANKNMLSMIYSRLGIGIAMSAREFTRDFYISRISEYIANGCKDPELTEVEKIMGMKPISQFVREAYDRECGPV